MVLGLGPALPVQQVLAENYKEFMNSNLEPNHLKDIFLRQEERIYFIAQFVSLIYNF